MTASDLAEMIHRADDADSRGAAIEEFLRTVVVVPSAEPDGEAFTPMLARVGDDDVLVCFTSAEALAASSAPAASVLTMVGASLVLRTPPDVGLVVDAGGRVLAMRPTLVRAVRDDVVRRTGA